MVPMNEQLINTLKALAANTGRQARDQYDVIRYSGDPTVGVAYNAGKADGEAALAQRILNTLLSTEERQCKVCTNSDPGGSDPYAYAGWDIAGVATTDLSPRSADTVNVNEYMGTDIGGKAL